MFGRSLAETIKFETRRGGGFVPLVVSKCVEFIKTYGKRSAILYIMLYATSSSSYMASLGWLHTSKLRNPLTSFVLLCVTV